MTCSISFALAILQALAIDVSTRRQAAGGCTTVSLSMHQAYQRGFEDAVFPGCERPPTVSSTSGRSTLSRSSPGSTRGAEVMRSILLACVALVVLAAMPASAHHSTANFDMTKSITLTGTVTYFAFTNPHSYFDMDVPDK